MLREGTLYGNTPEQGGWGLGAWEYLTYLKIFFNELALA